jgi:hypothetical protein
MTKNVTLEDIITGHVETVPRWKVADTIAAWYLDAGPVPEILEDAIEQLQESINRGEPFDGPAAYLGIRVTA